jgi:hypothetical protein
VEHTIAAVRAAAHQNNKVEERLYVMKTIPSQLVPRAAMDRPPREGSSHKTAGEGIRFPPVDSACRPMLDGLRQAVSNTRVLR